MVKRIGCVQFGQDAKADRRLYRTGSPIRPGSLKKRSRSGGLGTNRLHLANNSANAEVMRAPDLMDPVS